MLAAIHNHDVMTVAGRYGYKPALPAIGGTEGTGLVDALGSGVTGLAVGQRVTASGTGVWAEYFLAAAAGVVPLDDAVNEVLGLLSPGGTLLAFGAMSGEPMQLVGAARAGSLPLPVDQ